MSEVVETTGRDARATAAARTAVARRASSRRSRRAAQSTAAVLNDPSKRVLGLLALAGVAFLACALSIAIGPSGIPLGDSFGTVLGFDTGDNGLRVRELRGPRTITGLAVGGALGVAGALIQGMTRNPLADPWILGIEAGASFAVALGLFTLGITGNLGLTWMALAGAGATWLIVYAIGSAGRGPATPVNLTLAGAALGSVLAALTSAMIVLDSQTLDEYRQWIVGSLTDRGGDVLPSVAPFLAVGLVIALLGGRALNSLSLGDDVAVALGQRVGHARIWLALGIVLLAGGATAIAGPIAFAGLTVPHAARALVGPDYRWVVPYSALLGAALVLFADVVGRVIAPMEIPVGIVMGVIGAPLFIALVRRRKLAEL